MTDHLLHGIRVTSIATNVPGPVACARLTRLGAQVTKVEPPAGDALAGWAPAWYAELAAGQEVVQLDLKSDSDRAAMHALLASSDLFIASTRPSALARLGLDAATLGARYPQLCTVSIVGFASPNSDVAGHDLTYQADTGLAPAMGLPTTLVADLSAALDAVGVALALLAHRARTGAGGWREVALADCAHDFSAPHRHGLTAPGGVLGGGLPEYGSYRARDGVLVVAALEPHFRQRLLSVLGLPAPDHAAFAAAFASHEVAHWLEVARTHDLPIAAVSAP